MLESFDQILLFPGESAEDLATLQSHWTNDFPGTSFTLTTLRHDLIRADWNRRRAQRLLSELHSDLQATRLPVTHWDRITQRHLHFFEKNRAATQKEFRHAFRFLHSFKPTPLPAPVEVPEPPGPISKARLRQNVWVTVSPEGEVKTRVDMEPTRFLEQSIELFADEVARDFHFENSFIPEPYLYTLQHDDETYPSTGHLHIYYPLAEFQRLCRLEIQTKALHLLDGERNGYRWDQD